MLNSNIRHAAMASLVLCCVAAVVTLGYVLGYFSALPEEGSSSLQQRSYALTSKYGIRHIHWSPRGDQIALLRQAQDITIVSSAGIRSLPLPMGVKGKRYIKDNGGPLFLHDRWYHSLSWSPDGTRIAFLSHSPDDGSMSDDEGNISDDRFAILNCGTLKLLDITTGKLTEVDGYVRCFGWTPELTYVRIRNVNTSFDLIRGGSVVRLSIRGIPSAFSSDGRMLMSRSYEHLGRDDPSSHSRWMSSYDEPAELVISEIDYPNRKVLWTRNLPADKAGIGFIPDYDWVSVADDRKTIVISAADGKSMADLFRPMILCLGTEMFIYREKRKYHELP